MMLRFLAPRAGARSAGPDWTWQARIPALILTYGVVIFAVLIAERMIHSPLSASYAAAAVVPGGIAAGICAFALSFSPRPRLIVLTAVVIVALAPLGFLVFSIDFGEFTPIVMARAPLVAAMLAGGSVLATGLLIAGGVFPAPGEIRA
ncbi:hypothetical protein MKI84_17665 [Ancylobacter sp. A5.8]|uniref:hypothetical protein n=1 Tax=Ancylobacter gelatini TaxID=2919920 RepID=UPI001F4E1628|nr:hypothetical protein [Ancylobacter gelatini]MCJ8144752.1 hypothetical protein [Ancylobacter gelatini]